MEIASIILGKIGLWYILLCTLADLSIKCFELLKII